MTPPKPRAATPRPARSATKRATPKRKAGTPYDEATRAKALAMLEADGMAEAHRRSKVPKATLSRWARDAGVDLGEAARARTAVATENVRARAAEVTVATVAQLEAHLAQAGDYLATVAGVNALAARLIATGDPDDVTLAIGMAGPYTTLRDGTDAAELHKVALALAGLPLAVRDAEGMVTRAIHDLQLLKGEATERGTFRVEFAVPRPTASTDPVPEYDTDND